MNYDKFKKLLELKMEEIQTFDVGSAPIGFDNDEARAWYCGRESLMQWILEMFPTKEELNSTTINEKLKDIYNGYPY